MLTTCLVWMILTIEDSADALLDLISQVVGPMRQFTSGEKEDQGEAFCLCGI